MKKTMKRILALVLALLMCSALAAPIFAADELATCPGVGKIHKKDNCSYTKIGDHVPYCGEQGYTVYKCDGCGVYFADDIYSSDKEHEMEDATVAATCTTDGFEGEQCKVCGYKDGIIKGKLGHNVVFEGNNCENLDKEITGKCTRCDYTETLVVTGEHTWAKIPTIIKAPTCAADGQGLAEYACTKCDAKKEVVIYALDHKELINVEAVAPDCGWKNESGEIVGKNGNTAGVKCEVCGYTTVETIEAKHTFADTPTAYVAPTCTDYGFYFYGCTTCGEEAKSVGIAPYNHNFIDKNNNGVYDEGIDESLVVVDLDVKPTCTTPGVYSWHCALCPTVGGRTEFLALDHDLKEIVVDPTCAAEGYTYDACQREDCGYETAHRNPTPINPDNHNIDPLKTQSTAPNCIEDGKKTEYCADCSWYVQTVLPATGHNYDDGVETAPLCGVDGYITYTCQNVDCGHFYTEAGEKFDPKNAEHHDPAMKEVITGAKYPNREGSCTIVGITTYKCLTCSAGKQEPITYSIVSTEPGKNGQHAWEQVGETKLPEFCGDAGYLAAYVCTICTAEKGGEQLKTSIALHNMVVTKPAQAPTCLAAGWTAEKTCNCKFDILFAADDTVYLEDVECSTKVESIEQTQLSHVYEVLDSREMDCEEFGYIHHECVLCKADGWIDNYVEAREHEYAKNDSLSLAPDCDNAGYDYFECAHNATHHYTVDLEKLGHKDAEGNTIKCAMEDFFCSVCCDEDETVDFKKSHNFVVTEIPATCKTRAHVLYVCVDCEYFYTVYDNSENNFGGYVDHIAWGSWTVAEPATYTAPGKKVRMCNECGALETKEYVLEDVHFEATVDSGIVAGACIVNSGLVAVKLDISAYQIALWGVQVKINFNKDLVKLHSVVADTDIFADTVATSANGVATITSYVGNDEHEKLQNKVVNGKSVAYATVYFEVLDNAAAYSVLDFEFNVATYVVDKDQKVIDVTLADDIKAVEIHHLGDETMDGIIDLRDTIAVMSYITGEADKDYSAEADIDKDKDITVHDFANLMQHVSGAISYSALAAK